MNRDIIREEARLIILRELAADAITSSANEVLLHEQLDMHGILRSREWLRDELRRLHDLGAVELMQAGSYYIATLTGKGRDHLYRRIIIEGIKRPDRGG